MAYTATDLAAIQDAIVSGARRVRFTDGREVEYQSTKDLMAVQTAIEGSLAASQKPVVRRIKVWTKKDF